MFLIYYTGWQNLLKYQSVIFILWNVIFKNLSNIKLSIFVMKVKE